MGAKLGKAASAVLLAALLNGGPAAAMLPDRCENDTYIVYMAATTKFRFPDMTRTTAIAEIKEMLRGLIADGKDLPWTTADQAKVEKLVEYAFQHMDQAPEAAAAAYGKGCGLQAK